MKKVTSRSFISLLLAAAIVLGMTIYVFRLVKNGGSWASFYANDSVYTNGTLNSGTILDRDGTVLASAGETFTYADSYDVRVSTLHAVGDPDGSIGTGALSVFREQLVNYSFIAGTTRGGGTVQLSIDADLNVAAYNALAGRSGTVIVYNYETGQIVCMVSSPSFDPVSGYVDTDQSEGAYINRALSSTFVPGSVFKLVTLAAAIENIPDLFDQTFYCDGSVTIGDDTVTCSGVHGYVNIYDALAHSCNCAFAQLALQLGGDTIAQYAEAYGLTESHSLNGIETAAGSVTSGGGENASTAWEGIGQYEDLINPYAMLRLIGAIANGGTVVEPSLLYGESCGRTQLMKASTANTIADMMGYNVTNNYGSSSYPGLDMHAKTGTAEFGDGTSHAWFAGFITNSGSPYAFVVMVEKAGSGYSVASPIANTVLQKAVYG